MTRYNVLETFCSDNYDDLLLMIFNFYQIIKICILKTRANICYLQMTKTVVDNGQKFCQLIRSEDRYV